MTTTLTRVPIFRQLPAAAITALAAACLPCRFRRGETIFKEDRPADFVWIIRRGLVYLVKRTPSGESATIFTMTPDEALCGISAFEHGAYSAGAVAATDVSLLRIPAHVFAELLGCHPAFAGDVLRSCCGRIRQMAEAISVSQATVEQRLAYILVRLQDTVGRTIPVTRQELARMVGTRWETSIRTLSAMRRRGWIASSRGQVTVLAPQQLRALLQRTM